MPDFWVVWDGMFKASAVGYMVVIVLASLAAVMIKTMTNSTWMTLVFTIANTLGALAGMYVWQYAGVPIVSSKEANHVVGACLGMFVSFLIIMGILRLFYMVLESKKGLVRTDIAQQE